MKAVFKTSVVFSPLAGLFLLASSGYSTTPLPIEPILNKSNISSNTSTLTYLKKDDFKSIEVKLKSNGFEIEHFLVLTWDEFCGDVVEVNASAIDNQIGWKVAVMAKKTHYNVSCGFGFEPKEQSVSLHLGMGFMVSLDTIELNFLESDQTEMSFNAFSEEVVPFSGLEVDSIAPLCPPPAPGKMSCMAMGDVITLTGMIRCDQTLGATASKVLSEEDSNGSIVETTLFIDSNLTEESRPSDVLCMGIQLIKIKVIVSEGLPKGTTKENLRLIDFSTLEKLESADWLK